MWGHQAKQWIHRLTGLHVKRYLHRGVDLSHDLATSFPAYRMDVIFDVGANDGESALAFVRRFGESKVFSFEPVEASFQALRRNVHAYSRVSAFKLALASTSGAGQMQHSGGSKTYFLVDHSVNAIDSLDGEREGVEMDTLDAFCARQGVDRISFLKIDTEGSDLDVLQGGKTMLRDQRIDFVEVEAGMNPGNKRHVPFEALKQYLESLDYLLFGLYEQMDEFPTGEPHLRRCNAVYLSRRMIDSVKSSL